MRTAARILGQAFWIFLGLYTAALAMFVIGIFGLFGQPKEPLSGIFLILLGVPWLQLGFRTPSARGFPSSRRSATS